MKYKNEKISKLKEYIKNNNLTYYIETFGCIMNTNDSLKYANVLESIGFNKSNNIDESDFILFNTCAIRESAENTLYGRVGSLKNKNKIIAVVGCMTQQKHVIEKIKNSYRFVSIALGTHAYHMLIDCIYELLINNKKSYNNEFNDIEENVMAKIENKSSASVSIIYGCNNFCSYCIVPYVRGREKSRNKQDILKEIENLVNNGCIEITLLGQNVNSYGNDLKEDINFAKLLLEIEKIKGIKIIKFISPHPKDFSDELIEVISKSKKISKQIHLPLQSGNTRILNAMNRKYTKEDYLKLVKKIKSKIDNVTFSTDIIVGFPNETEQEFNDTLEVVKEVEFEQIYMFIFSKRKGTKAYDFEDNISYKEKTIRLEKLKNMHKEILERKNEIMLNKEYNVLVEGKSKKNEKLYSGRTKFNKLVLFKGNDKDIGNIIKVKIVKNNLWYVTGEKI